MSDDGLCSAVQCHIVRQPTKVRVCLGKREATDGSLGVEHGRAKPLVPPTKGSGPLRKRRGPDKTYRLKPARLSGMMQFESGKSNFPSMAITQNSKFQMPGYRKAIPHSGVWTCTRPPPGACRRTCCGPRPCTRPSPPAPSSKSHRICVDGIVAQVRGGTRRAAADDDWPAVVGQPPPYLEVVSTSPEMYNPYGRRKED